jgi:hypothetical protein
MSLAHTPTVPGLIMPRHRGRHDSPGADAMLGGDADPSGSLPVVRKLTIGLAMVVALVVSAGALAAVAAPHAGKWKISGGGGFTVSKDRASISGLHLSGSSCGLGRVTVLGAQKLRLISAGGVSNWIVGFNDPKRTNPNDLHGLVGQKVEIRSGKQKLRARLDVIFAVGGFQRDNSGDLLIKGCDLGFDPSP